MTSCTLLTHRIQDVAWALKLLSVPNLTFSGAISTNMKRQFCSTHVIVTTVALPTCTPPTRATDETVPHTVDPGRDNPNFGQTFPNLAHF